MGRNDPAEVERRRLRVLCVDDEPADYERERLTLAREFAVEGARIDTVDAFTAALRTGGFDVILCGYSMPQCSGMDALKLWQAAGRPVPFIFVTGKLSEEVAVECIKAGATDYVLKGNLARLPTAVERALREFASVRALQHAEAERARVIAAIDQTEEVVVITAPDGSIVYVNPAFTRVTGYQPEEAIGRKPSLLRSGVQESVFYTDLWARISAGEVWRGRLINRRRDGSLYHAEMTVAPVFSGGQIVNFCAIQRDVSDRVAHDQRLRDVHAKLAETDRLKDEFLAAFSHELRTPLNVILGYTDLLAEELGPQLDPEMRRFLDAIGRSATQLTGLINETLDLARLRVDAVRLRFSALDAGALVREVAESCAAPAASKGLALTCEIPPTPIETTTDPVRLRQIVGNLIDNAIKFTERGEVRVRADCDARSLIVEVRDTGIGVAADDIANIFEDFRQLQGGMTRRYGGCGLGLAIVKRMVTLLGGSVEVESASDRGSCFRLRIPRTAPSER